MISVELDGEAVLYDERSGALHLLDPVGAVVWSGLDGAVTVAGLAQELAEVYEGERAVIERDVLRLVRELAGLGLVRVEGSGSEVSPGEQGHPR